MHENFYVVWLISREYTLTMWTWVGGLRGFENSLKVRKLWQEYVRMEEMSTQLDVEDDEWINEKFCW